MIPPAPPPPLDRRVGCVSFLNARPLIEGLDDRPDLAIRYDVPSGLLDDLLTRRVGVALCPVVDFQLAPEPLKIIPVGGIGCDGPTLTVRLFSRTPLHKITHVRTDAHSHTSNVLMRVLLHDLFHIRPELTHPTPPDPGTERSPRSPRTWVPPAPHADHPHHPRDDEAVLLIGDKVVTAAPSDHDCPHQLDLGQAWRELTGLPFVFAVWMALHDTDLGDVPHILDEQRRTNAQQIDRIVARRAADAGWPDDLARRYLGELLRYAVGPREVEAMQRFWRRAHDLGFLPRHRPLATHEAAGC